MIFARQLICCLKKQPDPVSKMHARTLQLSRCLILFAHFLAFLARAYCVWITAKFDIFLFLLKTVFPKNFQKSLPSLVRAGKKQRSTLRKNKSISKTLCAIITRLQIEVYTCRKCKTSKGKVCAVRRALSNSTLHLQEIPFYTSLPHRQAVSECSKKSKSLRVYFHSFYIQFKPCINSMENNY